MEGRSRHEPSQTVAQKFWIGKIKFRTLTQRHNQLPGLSNSQRCVKSACGRRCRWACGSALIFNLGPRVVKI